MGRGGGSAKERTQRREARQEANFFKFGVLLGIKKYGTVQSKCSQLPRSALTELKFSL